MLPGAAADEASFRRAAEVALRGARPREHNAFKIELARRVIVRAFTEVAGGQPGVRKS
jgi:xanthine dehydrogenase YagS FAD-binding subunit